MKKNVKKPWIILCSFVYLFFFCKNIRAAEPVTMAITLPAVAASWAAGHTVNFIGKNFGSWFTDEVLGSKGIGRKVLALDFKFYLNDVLKNWLIGAGCTFDNGGLATTTAFESGIKYISVQELYILLKRAWIQWDKLHPQAHLALSSPELLPGTNTNSTINITQELIPEVPHTLFTGGQELVYYFYNQTTDKIEWIRNIPEMTAVIVQSLAADIPGVSIEVLYYFVSYYLTVFTQLLSKNFLEPFIKASGWTSLNKKPVSTIILASIGIIVSEYFMLHWTMDQLKNGLKYLDLYKEDREGIHLLMYKAGIKTPFALEGIKKGYATVTNPQFYMMLKTYIPYIKPALITVAASILHYMTRNYMGGRAGIAGN